MEKIITLDKALIDKEHICCAISDKKCAESYQQKKEWLKEQFNQGYVFRKLDARAKVFIEYGPAENGWVPIEAPNYLLINCFWVSGKYKGNGYGKKLLELAWQDAVAQGKHGLVSVVGTKKYHFMSDTKWLLKQGFQTVKQTTTGFSLIVKKVDSASPDPVFKPKVLLGECEEKSGLVAYYSNRCPFSEYHVLQSLKESASIRNLPLTIIKLETLEQAQASPSPATIFSLFYQGKFVTTDVGVCMNSRFDKIMGKYLE